MEHAQAHAPEPQLAGTSDPNPIDRTLEIVNDLQTSQTAARLKLAIEQGCRFLEHTELAYATREQLEFTGDAQKRPISQPQQPCTVQEEAPAESKSKNPLNSVIEVLQRNRPASLSNPARKLRKLRKPPPAPSSQYQAASLKPSSSIKRRISLRSRTSSTGNASDSAGVQASSSAAASSSSIETPPVRQEQPSSPSQTNHHRLSLGDLRARSKRLSFFSRGRDPDHDQRLASVRSIHSEDGDDELNAFLSPVHSRTGADVDANQAFSTASPLEPVPSDPLPRHRAAAANRQGDRLTASHGFAAHFYPNQFSHVQDPQQPQRRHHSLDSGVPQAARYSSSDYSCFEAPTGRKMSIGHWSTDSESRHSWTPDVPMSRLSLLSDEAPSLLGSSSLPIYSTEPQTSHSASSSLQRHPQSPALSGSEQPVSTILRTVEGSRYLSTDFSDAESSDLPTGGSMSDLDDWQESQVDGSGALVRKLSTRTATNQNVKGATVIDRPLEEIMA